LISIAFIMGSIESTQTQHKNRASSKKGEIKISPNVSDVKNLVKPFIQGPYKPIEVNSLYEYKAPVNDEMTKAEIIGQQASFSGVVEKPRMYDTIIAPHATGIRHAFDQRSKEFSTQEANSMTNNQNEAGKLIQGQLNIPVRLATHGLVQDPSLANYETPVFLTKKQDKVAENPLPSAKTPSLSPDLTTTSSEDAGKIQTKLEAAHSLIQQREALKSEKKRLQEDSQKITKQIQEQIASLVKAKSISQSLDNLLNKYTVKMKKAELSKIKLVDRVEIKKQLKEKLLREVEGFRNAGNQFTKIKDVDPADLSKIIKEIEHRLGK